MKKIISLLLITILLSQSLPSFAAGNEFGLSILDEQDYNIIAPPLGEDAAPPADQAAISDRELMQFSEKFWRDAVRAIDGDNPLEAYIPPSITSLRPSFALPLYGTSVSLTGRKTFGVKGESKKYKYENSNATSSKSYNNFTFEQQMQIKMQGKIVDRIFVDIDYDDQADDMQDISVTYVGKEGELVQSAEFGDITLDLPKTEFISFEKQLFGAKMHLQHGGANLRLIGSKTKGTNKNKQFQGSSVFETITLRDTSYIRRTYYSISQMLDASDANYPFLRYEMAKNTEKIYINDGTSSSQYRFETLDYADFADPSDVKTNRFRLLERGVDYNIDYSRNMIVFKYALKESDEVVIDYTNSAGQQLGLQALAGGYTFTYKTLKAESDRPQPGGRASTYTEVKTVYNLNRQQITRDDGKGNFTLVLQDANGNNIGAQEDCFNNPLFKCPQLYPNTIDVDFEKGIFELKNKLNDSSLYNNTPVSNRNLSFKVELTSKVKSYFIEGGIVLQSETVKINGRTLSRNDDYYIDYSSGFITFYKEGLITQDSVIDVTYDTTGGSSSDLTLLGARFDYDFTDNIGIGATVLQEGADAPTTAPSISGLSEKLTVYEVDAKAKDVHITDDLKFSLSGEAAKSIKDQNIFGYALVDNFEDAKQLTAPSTTFNEWQIASTPSFEYNGGDNAFWGTIRWDTQDVRSLEINPNSQSSSGDTQPVLLLDYDFSKAPSGELSIVYPLSDSGVDLSEKNMFELTALGAAGGPDINIHFGEIHEISDSSKGDNSITCSIYYDPLDPNASYVPKTEDKYCRSTVSPEEDKGWVFEDPDGTLHNYDPFINNIYNREKQPNGRVDTQDLDGDGKLDKGDPSIGGSFGYDPAPYTAVNIAGMPNGYTLSNTSWQTFTTPVVINNKDKWTNIKHVRITLKKSAGGSEKGQIKIANVGMSGNTWQLENEDDKISAINKIDNTDYLPIFDDYKGAGRNVFNALYGSVDELRSESRNQNVFEQALKFDYDTSSVKSTISANRSFGKMDFTTHKKLKFLLYVKNNDANSLFFLRLGTEINYQEIRVSLDSDALVPGQWNLIELKIADLNGDGIADGLQPITPGTTVDVIYDAVNPANINFSKISRITTGVTLKTGTPGGAGEVWLNELHVSDSVSLEAYAYRGDVKVELENWGEAGASYIQKDENFQTPVSVATGQDRKTEDYYLKLKRIEYLPVEAKYQRSSVDTPRILEELNTNTVRSLDQGLVEKDTGSVKVDFIKKDLPQVSAEYNFSNAEYNLAQRKDAKETYSANVRQNFPSGKFLRDYNVGYTISKTKIDYSPEMNLASNSYYNTDESLQRINTRVSFEPWKGSSITPTYSLTTVKEDRSGAGINALSYPKAMNQQAGVTANFRILPWLVPAVSYNITTTETNNLSAVTLSKNGINQDFEVGELKNINRSADGGISLTLSVKEIFPSAKFFGNLTLSNSYKLQDADSYVNVEDSLNTKTNLWVRKDLAPSNPYAYKRHMTLRDTFTSSQRWYPFRDYAYTGSLAPLRTLSVINNFTQTFQDAEETGTPTKTISKTLPDTVITLSEVEKFFGENYWLSNTSVKLRTTQIENEIVDTEIKKDVLYSGELRFMVFNIFDNTLLYTHRNMDRDSLSTGEILERQYSDEFSAQTSFYLKRWRISPKFAYVTSEKTQRAGTVTEEYTDIIPSLNIRVDFSLPGGIWLPFVNRNYATTNRIIWNTNFMYQQRRSDVTVLDNKNVYSFDTSLDYEFSKNLRLTLSGGVEMLDHLYVESESYFGYNFGTMLTLQF